MKDTTLYEVRCPALRAKGNTRPQLCDSLCGKVSKLTMGELLCRKCKVPFRFVVNEDGEVVTIDFEQTTIIKNKKPETPEDRLLALVNG